MWVDVGLSIVLESDFLIIFHYLCIIHAVVDGMICNLQLCNAVIMSVPPSKQIIMEKEFNFDDMRPYRDDEINDAILRVADVPQIREVMKFLFPDKNPDEIINHLKRIRTIHDFQHQFIAPLIFGVTRGNNNPIFLNGLEHLQKEKKYLYISNHRDIIMDAGIFSTMLDRAGWDTTEIAIGDNLCANQWITDSLKMNKCFLVKRSGTRRELYDAFLKLSAYIRRSITEMNNSIWIAQREGRAKDSDDRTQESLLKMLSVSAQGNLKQSFIELNIVPFCISYEYDSCDFLKAREFQQKRDDANYVKSKADDILNMKTGILGNKGQIYYEVTPPINDEIEKKIDEEDNRTTVLNKVADIIDRRIHKNYHLFPNNYIAHDLLFKKKEFADKKYSEDEKKRFEDYVDIQISKIDLEDKDIPFLKEKFWLMYANPLTNFTKANRP